MKTALGATAENVTARTSMSENMLNSFLFKILSPFKKYVDAITMGKNSSLLCSSRPH